MLVVGRGFGVDARGGALGWNDRVGDSRASIALSRAVLNTRSPVRGHFSRGNRTSHAPRVSFMCEKHTGYIYTSCALFLAGDIRVYICICGAKMPGCRADLSPTALRQQYW